MLDTDIDTLTSSLRESSYPILLLVASVMLLLPTSVLKVRLLYNPYTNRRCSKTTNQYLEGRI